MATFISKRGIKRKSLSPMGAATAWMVGFLSIASGLRGCVLLMFYQFGTLATKYGKELKIKKDGDAGKSSVRGPSQVLACSAIAVLLSLIHAIYFGEEKTIDFNRHKYESSLTCAVIAHHATCLADTLASELGILAKSDPVLLTAPWRRVPAGTNGGVTMIGFFWSLFGGVLMGAGTLLMDYLSGIETRPVRMMIYSGACGLIGSFLDSFLGATVQATFYDKERKLIFCERDKNTNHICGMNILSNAQVNAVSVLMTTMIGGLILAPMIF